MALELLNIIEIIEVMENYMEQVRPPEHIRNRLDLTYKIDNQSIILQELRPKFRDPDQIMESGYAKATFVKSEKKWKVYWMGSNLKWTLYEPEPEVGNLKKFLNLVDEDKYHCFKG